MMSDCEKKLSINGSFFRYFDLKSFQKQGYSIDRFPFLIRILLENVLRSVHYGKTESEYVLQAADWEENQGKVLIPFFPSRILMQDLTGVPAFVDMASMRSAAAQRGLDPDTINSVLPVDLIIDHSVQVDFFGSNDSCSKNVEREYARNRERYLFLKWVRDVFRNVTVMAPGKGICHQVNLEYLAKVIQEKEGLLFPDTLIGTDSHSTMINGAGVLGWGVGGIEAEAAMLGEPVDIVLPKVLGVKLVGRLPAGTTSTDMVLSIVERLRKVGVVGRFVEFYGDGSHHLSVPDRATIANMSPEFGCTAAYFPIDSQTVRYLEQTGRSRNLLNLVETYARANLLWKEDNDEPEYTDAITIDLEAIVPAVAGPSRPQDRIILSKLKENVRRISDAKHRDTRAAGNHIAERNRLTDGDVVIAAITSCTNTSNPSVMIAAGLLARNAFESGLTVPRWVKTSLAPGSKVVVEYLRRSGIMQYLDWLGFYLVGYGCTTCIGNSGELDPDVLQQIHAKNIRTAAVLSGNRNFPARIHPAVAWNFLASPPLVLAFALAGNMDIDFHNDPIGQDASGRDVYLKDIWPDSQEIRDMETQNISADMFTDSYRGMYVEDDFWRGLKTPAGSLFSWDEKSEYVREAPFFKAPGKNGDKVLPINGARVLLQLGDSITTDHISPAGAFAEDSPAGRYLSSRGVQAQDYNTYGSRRGNHEVLTRGTFANVSLRNYLVDRQGGYTLIFPEDSGIKPGSADIARPAETTVWDAAESYRLRGVPLIILAGKEYGTGSSRDWAAKGPALLGVRAVIAESFERIHRSNLTGMGIIPLQFMPGQSWNSLGLTGHETYSIYAGSKELQPKMKLVVSARPAAGPEKTFEVQLLLISQTELEYLRCGGMLRYVFEGLCDMNQ